MLTFNLSMKLFYYIYLLIKYLFFKPYAQNFYIIKPNLIILLKIYL